MKTTHDVSEDAFSGETVPLDDDGSKEAKRSVIEVSRSRYGKPKAEVEAYLQELFAEIEGKEIVKKNKPKKTPSKKVGT